MCTVGVHKRFRHVADQRRAIAILQAKEKFTLATAISQYYVSREIGTTTSPLNKLNRYGYVGREMGTRAANQQTKEAEGCAH